MPREIFMFKRTGQTILEYTLVLSAVILIISAMTMLIKRSTQGMIRVVADQVGIQENGDQRFDETGHLESSYISTVATIDTTSEELMGITKYIHGDQVESFSNADINLGFQERPPI